MKTQKQVLDLFAKLQKRFIGIRGFVDLRYYTDGDYWDVSLKVTAFNGGKLMWAAELTWSHGYYHTEADEAENEAKIEKFIKLIENKIA